MSKSLVLSFSRNNPISAGHQKLFQAVKKIGQQKNATVKCYMSQTHNNKKDPITYEQKVNLAKQLMPDLASQFVIDKSVKSVIDVLKANSNKEVDLYFVAGSDRVPEYKTLLNKYNGKDYTYKSIEVVSAGERDPDAEGVTGISGTKMREFAVNGDFKSFKSGAPVGANEKVVKEMYNIVRDSLGVKEAVKESEQKVITSKIYYDGGLYEDSNGNAYDYFIGTMTDGIEFASKFGYGFKPVSNYQMEDIVSEAVKKVVKKAGKTTADESTKQIKVGTAKNKVVVNPSLHEYGKTK